MSTAANGYVGTGAGGKLRRKPFRNSQSTPYDRPSIALRNPSSGNGWVSKIIEPASRIITASAHRLFPSLFRKRLLPPPSRQQMPPPALVATVPASEVDRPSNSKSGGEIQEKVGDQYQTGQNAKEPDSLGNNGDNQGFYELEKMLEQKTFTKSEIDRLTALLKLRTIEAPAEENKKSRARVSETVHTNGKLIASMSIPADEDNIKLENHLGAGSSLMVNTMVLEEHTDTPAELAKAYMGSRSSIVSPSMLGSRGLATTTRNDVPLINNVVFPSQSLSMNTATKSSSQLITPKKGYTTPRSGGRSAIYSMARTPYSRMQKGSDFRSGNNYSIQSYQLSLEPNKLGSSRQTTLKRRSSDFDDDIGSVGPMRRIRQKPGFLPSHRFNGPASRDSHGLKSNNLSKDAGNETSDAKIMSVSSQSSEVAQKILQQLDKMSPTPKEKLSDRTSVQLQGKVPFTLTEDMLTGQALRSLEDVDSSKFMKSALENGRLNDSFQRVTTIVDNNTMNGKNKVEENGPKKMTSIINANSEGAFYASDLPPAINKRAFQMSAHEDYLDLDDYDGGSNGTSFSVAENRVNRPLTSSEENKNQINLDGKQSDSEHAASSGPFIPEKKDKFSYSAGTPALTIQPTVTDNGSSSHFGKVSSRAQGTTTALFGHAANTDDKFTPITHSSSGILANDSMAVHSASSELKAPNLSVLLDPATTKSDDNNGALVSDAREGKPSTASLYGVSPASTIFSYSSSANNGFICGSFSGQPAIVSASAPSSKLKNVNDNGAHDLASSGSTALTARVPNTETGITSGGSVSLLSTPSAPFSAPNFSSGHSFKDPQVSSSATGSVSDVEGRLKSVSGVSNIISNPFCGSGLSSGMSNSFNVVSGFGSSTSSPIVDNQSLGCFSNAGNGIVSQAATVRTAAENDSKSTPFQLSSSGFSSSPFSLSGTAAFASASAGFSVSAPATAFGSDTTHGFNSFPFAKQVTEVSTVATTSGSANSLFGSNWQSNSASIFGSTTNSSTTPLSVFSAASSASIPTSSMPGSLFGSTGASAGSSLSFTSALPNNSPSPFSAQPVFGSPSPAFDFGSTASPANNGCNNNQMTVEDTMAEDTVLASAISSPLFGQQQSNPGFVFGSLPPSTAQPVTDLFQFGSQPSPAAPVNRSPFQASGNGGSFSLGAGGGDKSGRKIIRVNKSSKRR